MVHSDSDQTLRVLVIYNHKKSESLVYDLNMQSKTIIVTDSVIGSDQCSYYQLHRHLEIELSDKRTYIFTVWVMGIYSSCLA